MKRLYIAWVLSLTLLASCASTPTRSTNDSMLNFLPYLNQKVAGYISTYNIKQLDAETYKDIVNKVCGPLPSCSTNADTLFNTYAISVHTMDGMFSIMLCDKNGLFKEMEDFSCNEEAVEIKSFEDGPKMQCQFEVNWRKKIKPYCPEDK